MKQVLLVPERLQDTETQGKDTYITPNKYVLAVFYEMIRKNAKLGDEVF